MKTRGLQFIHNGKAAGKMVIKNQSETETDLNIFGDIVSDDWGKWSDDDTCPTDISEFLKDLDGVNKINLHINSGGGSVFGGIAIYNMLKRHKAKITTYIDGLAASIASVIACAGDKIIIPANGTFMIHKPTLGYFLENMNADELRKDADRLDICQKAILQSYMSKTKENITEEQIEQMINSETWLVGSNAAEYFDFEVEESVQAVACTSDCFKYYKKAPENTDKQKDEIQIDMDKLVDAVAHKIEIKNKSDENEKLKNELIEDLYLYGA